MTQDGGEDPTHPQGNQIEALLAQQAQEAIAHGKDPKKVSDRLGSMISHLRGNPDVAVQANEALAKGKDPLAVGRRVFDLAARQQFTTDVHGIRGDITSRDAAATPGASASALSGAAQGSTFGLADEILGGIDAANKMIPASVPLMGGQGAPLSKFGENYRSARDKVRDFDTRSSNAHSTAHLTGALAGGLLPVLATGGAGSLTSGASVGAKIGNAALQGAGYGAATGVGTAKDLSDVPREALTSGLIGGAGGALVQGALSGGGALARSLGIPNALSRAATRGAEVLGDESALGKMLRTYGASTGIAGEANTAINTGLANEGATPDDILAKVRQNVAQSGDRPEVIADYSPELLKTTKSVAKQPGAGRSKVLAAITGRNADARTRVLDDLGGGAIPQDARAGLEGLTRARSASAEALKQGMNNQAIDDPVVSEILARPTFKDIFGDAQRLAADEGRTLPTTVTYKIPPQLQAGIDAQPLADQPRVIQKLVDAGVAQKVEVPAPDVESIAYIERALKDRIQSGFNGTGSTGKNQAAVLQKGFQQIRDRVAALSPEYDAFLTDFADRSQPIDAGTLGLNLSKYTDLGASKVPKQALGRGDPLALKATRTGLTGIERAVGNLSDESRAAFQAGAKTNIVDAANALPATADGSTTGVLRGALNNSPRSARIQSLLFESPDELGTFQHALGRERNMAATGGLFKGSDTAENLAEQQAMSKSGILSKLFHPIRALTGAAEAGDEIQNQALRAALGDRLSQTGQTGMQSVLADAIRASEGRSALSQSQNVFRNALVPQLPFVGAPQ